LTEKVISWFEIHRPKLLAHIESKQPDSAPPRLWWVAFLSMHHFTTRAAVTFCSIQGLTTLVLQQRNALDNLIASFIDDIGVIGPLTAESIVNIDPSTHVINGHYVIVLSSVREFLVGPASWVDTLLNEANESDHNALQHDIALVYITACDQIHEISHYCFDFDGRSWFYSPSATA
jgi:hypothetical protein